MFSWYRSLLGEIQPLLHGRSHQLRQLMEDHNLEELPDSEQPWNVPEPKIVIAMPPKKPGATECFFLPHKFCRSELWQKKLDFRAKISVDPKFG